MMNDLETDRRKVVYNDILGAIGNTPMVRLNRVGKDEGIKATLLAKVDYFNPTGSLKDRMGLAIIEDAEQKGLLRPGGTIVEYTSGNTGLGLTLPAIVKGYKIILTMPTKMVQEKVDLLRAYGAKVIITPTKVRPDSPKHYVNLAKKIAKETPGGFLSDQFDNPANVESHYKTTGPEIWEQTNGEIDYFVASIGTGGTIVGASKYLKEKNPKIKMVGVDPVGSLFADFFWEYKEKGEVSQEIYDKLKSSSMISAYKVEGIGEDFMPKILDFDYVDEMIKVSDRDSFLNARRLAREEALFVGGSSGTALFGALQLGKRLGEGGKGKTIVVLLPDGGRDYLSKMYSDKWMKENGYL